MTLACRGRGDARADVRRTALSGAQAECQKTGLLDETPQRHAGLRAVRALVHRLPCQDGIDMDTWNSLVPRPQVGSVFIWPRAEVLVILDKITLWGGVLWIYKRCLSHGLWC